MNFLTDNINNVILLGLVIVSGLALLLPALQRRGKTVTPLQATLMMNKEKAVVVDIRGADDYAKGHLREARNIPLGDLPGRVGELDKVKTRPVIVVCQTGARAARATALLEKAGFTAYGLDGGLAAWTAGGLPVTKEA